MKLILKYLHLLNTTLSWVKETQTRKGLRKELLYEDAQARSAKLEKAHEALRRVSDNLSNHDNRVYEDDGFRRD